MKTLNEKFTDEEFAKLEALKKASGKSWHNFILDPGAPVKEEFKEAVVDKYGKATISRTLAGQPIEWRKKTMNEEHTATIYAKCLCGSVQPVNISNRLHPGKIYAGEVDRHSHALMGLKHCSQCGRELWVYGYLAVHEKGFSKENEEFVKKMMDK